MKSTNPPTPATAQVRTSAALRLPPQDVEAEKSLLGGLLLDNKYLVDTLEMLRGDMFYREVHGVIFEAMRSLHELSEPVDVVTVRDAAKEIGETWTGQEFGVYLLGLAEFVPSAASSLHYASIICEKWKLRQVIELSSKAAGSALALEDSGGIISEVQQQLVSIASVGQRGQWKDIKTLLRTYTDDLEERYHGGGNAKVIPTGFVDIDRFYGGFKKSELAIIAARSSMGKTSLAMQMAVNQASLGYSVAVFSLEMSAESLMNRMVSCLASVPSTSLDNGRLSDEQWSAVQVAGGKLWDLPLSIEDESDLTIMQIESKVRELHVKGGLDAVYIDYLTLIRLEGKSSDNRSQQVGDAAKALKNMAKKYDIAMQCLSQLSRGLESRDDKRPRMSDLRDSGNIEEHTDKAIFIYRPMYYARKGEAGDVETNGTEPEEAEIIFGKNRNGAQGMVKLEFTPAYTRFGNAVNGEF